MALTGADPADDVELGPVLARGCDVAAGVVEIVDADLRPPGEHEVGNSDVDIPGSGAKGIGAIAVLSGADRLVVGVDQQRPERVGHALPFGRFEQAQHRLLARLVAAEGDAVQAVALAPDDDLVNRRWKLVRGVDDHARWFPWVALPTRDGLSERG